MPLSRHRHVMNHATARLAPCCGGIAATMTIAWCMCRKLPQGDPPSQQDRQMQHLIQAMHSANYTSGLAATMYANPLPNASGARANVNSMCPTIAKPVPQLPNFKPHYHGNSPQHVTSDQEAVAVAVSKGPSAFHAPAANERHLIQAISIKPKVRSQLCQLLDRSAHMFLSTS